MIEPEERRTENVVFRMRPSELRRLEAAADVAGVTRSRIIRSGTNATARQILQRAATDSGDRGES